MARYVVEPRDVLEIQYTPYINCPLFAAIQSLVKVLAIDYTYTPAEYDENEDRAVKVRYGGDRG